MSVLRLRKIDGLNPEVSYVCSEFDFATAWRMRGQYGNTMSIPAIHNANLNAPWFGINITCDCRMIDGESIVYAVFDPCGDRLTQSLQKLTTDCEVISNKACVRIKDSYFTEVYHGYAGDIYDASTPVAERVLYEQFRAQYITEYPDLTYYTRREYNGFHYWQPCFSGDALPTSNIPAYYKCDQDFTERYYCNDGLYEMHFGVKSTPYFYDNNFRLFSGVCQSIISEYVGEDIYHLQVGTTDFIDSGMRFGFYMTTPTNSRWWNDEYENVPFVETQAVHFIIPAGTYTTGSLTFTLTEDKIMFGTATYNRNNSGTISQVQICAVESKCWKSAENRAIDMGDDSQAMGGNGPFILGKDSSLGTIQKIKKNGISTDPSASGGFFIYKFTESEWSSFLSSLNNGLASPTVNTERIAFIYRSPLNFPTRKYHFPVGIFVGSVAVTNGLTGYDADVVQETMIEGQSNQLDNEWNAQSYIDLEPYSSTSVQVPFCKSLDIPPSYFFRSTGVVKYTYELVSRAAVATIVLNRNNEGQAHFNTYGECAAELPILLTKGVVGEMAKSMLPVAASGVATVATGGTMSPLIVGTAAGAARGFVTGTTNMCQTHIPNMSSSSPYWDTVNSGEYCIALLGVKTERLTSGERGTNERAVIEGYRSGFYCEQLRTLLDGANSVYVQVESINLRMSTGMTKAEHDEIVALLKEGVIL